MKLICNQSELLNSLNIALRAVSNKTSLPILECFLLEAENDGLVITTNDMELGIETRLMCRVDTPGRIAVNARIFSDIIRKLSDDIVIIEVGDNYVMYITCGKANFKIVGVPGNDFPMLPTYEKNAPLTISQFTLKEMISKTIFSISSNDNSAILTGENFEIEGNNLRVTALDGHRVAIRNIEMKTDYMKCSAVIPGKTLQEISKILSGNIDDTVNIYFMERQIVFEMDHTVVLSRLIEGKYYNVNQMLNSGYDTKVIINKRELMDCLDRVLLLVKESEKRPVIIDIQDGRMCLNMNTSIGSMDEEISVFKEGNDLTIGFNPKFLLDALRAIDDEEISLEMTTVKRPCFIRDDANTYTYMILPVNFVGR